MKRSTTEARRATMRRASTAHRVAREIMQERDTDYGTAYLEAEAALPWLAAIERRYTARQPAVVAADVVIITEVHGE